MTDINADGPVLEHAVLEVRAGQAAEFEEALGQALPIIRSATGCVRANVSRCVESPSRFLLLVEWERLADHDPGFRSSSGYQQWRALLHHFYDPMPVVEHFAEVGPKDVRG
ncbi:MAG: antibiotic biosynthesis monooxygenase [Nocardioides sp.]|uniref:antibiotic biosynthesis monooxygenase family protein n=1 Tax=Nocardioides sp. TaxID=35761 RepID=UPI0039E394D5